jgi:hypothetical protein
VFTLIRTLKAPFSITFVSADCSASSRGQEDQRQHDADDAGDDEIKPITGRDTPDT